MTTSELIRRAWALREQSRFRESYTAFVDIAKVENDVLKKSALLLDDVTNLTMLDEHQASREELEKIKGLLATLDPRGLSQIDQTENLHLSVRVEIEQAELFAAEGDIWMR